MVFISPRTEQSRPPPVGWGPTLRFDVGGDLLSHTLTSAVPSALVGLASGFGMGPGVPPPPQPPTTLSNYRSNLVDAKQDLTHPEHHNGCVFRVAQWMQTTRCESSPRPISTS